jgi:hypothetical protein
MDLRITWLAVFFCGLGHKFRKFPLMYNAFVRSPQPAADTYLSICARRYADLRLAKRFSGRMRHFVTSQTVRSIVADFDRRQGIMIEALRTQFGKLVAN